MKKITAFTIAAIMALGMTACGDTEKSAEKEQASKSAAANDENSDNSISEEVREDLLKAANNNAKLGYTAVAEYLADMETQGRISEATEQEAADFAIKELGSNGNISGTVGVRFDGSDDYGFLNFTVQFRADEDSTVIGQYPEPAQSVDDIPAWAANAEASYTAE
ncbi:hypothetical protein [Ruminococcus albus]|uniref:Lipoprotein n=1 Tax=Ruminococcus albus TaxID=1264 RepID=A0A1I1FUQ0_RUMAL|nr:hypothetical protein [Ruminococcus albus]SFC03035.1 hypothetical protein SAMN02910406_01023 [Ruminococcus albus]